MINRSIRVLKDILNMSSRNVELDEMNSKLSLQNESLMKRISELEYVVKETVKEIQKSLYEIRLRTLDVIEIDKVNEPILFEIRELVRPQKYGIANLEFFGNEFDGGYLISSKIGKRINLISIGIGDNFSFDLAVAKRGGTIHMYDGTINKIQNLPDNVTFIEKNVGNNAKNNEIELSSVVNKFMDNLSSLDDINVIKIDVEGAEWEIFNTFDFRCLKNFNTLVVEFHEINEMLKNQDKQQMVIDVLSSINRYFVPVYFSPNNWSQVIRSGKQLMPNVFEIVYINRVHYVDEHITAHDSADYFLKPKNNPYRPSLGRFFT